MQNGESNQNLISGGRSKTNLDGVSFLEETLAAFIMEQNTHFAQE